MCAGRPRAASSSWSSALDTAKPFAQEIERCVKEQHGGMYALVLQAADADRARAARLVAHGDARDDALPGEAVICGTRFLIG